MMDGVATMRRGHRLVGIVTNGSQIISLWSVATVAANTIVCQQVVV